MAARQKVEFILTARDLTRRAFRRIRNSLADIKGRLAALVGVGALAKLTTDAARFAKNIRDASRALGITTTELQALQDVGRQYGIDADDVQDSLFSISTAMSEVGQGNDEMRRTFRRLGFDQLMAQGRTNPLDYFLQLSTVIQGAGGDFRRYQADLNRILGEDVSRRLMPVFRAGPAQLVGNIVDAVTGGRVASAEEINTGAQAVIEAQKLLARTNVELLAGINNLAAVIQTQNTIAIGNPQGTGRAVEGNGLDTNPTGFSGYSP